MGCEYCVGCGSGRGGGGGGGVGVGGCGCGCCDGVFSRLRRQQCWQYARIPFACYDQPCTHGGARRLAVCQNVISMPSAARAVRLYICYTKVKRTKASTNDMSLHALNRGFFATISRFRQVATCGGKKNHVWTLLDLKRRMTETPPPLPGSVTAQIGNGRALASVRPPVLLDTKLVLSQHCTKHAFGAAGPRRAWVGTVSPNGEQAITSRRRMSGRSFKRLSFCTAALLIHSEP